MKKMALLVAVLMLAVMSFTGCSLAGAADDTQQTPVLLSSTDETPATVDNELSSGESIGQSVDEDANAEEKNTVMLDGKEYRQKENITNILLMGIDSDAERVKNSQGWRSDMLMLVTIDSDTDHITCTSIPRDTRANVYKLDDNGTIVGEVTEKINHAYAYGGGPTKYSAENAMRCTEELLECSDLIDVPINYYISIDLDGIQKLANEMGGVEVTLDQNVPDVGKKGETVLLKGETTRKFLENRHDMSDGELTRQRHEQMFIKSLARSIKEMGAVQAAPELYDTFIKFMRTNLTLDEAVDLAKVLDKTNIDDMTFNVWEQGAPEIISGVWYYRASQDEIIHQMLDAVYDEV